MKQLITGICCASLLFLTGGCGGAKAPKTESTAGDAQTTETSTMQPHETGAKTDTTTTASGLQFIDIMVGDGARPEVGKMVAVHYTGWLLDGTKFDSSKDRNQPFTFQLGQGKVIRGWDEGVAGMRVGGTRKLIIPPDLGYGSRGAGNVIPPNATLVFEVELLGIG